MIIRPALIPFVAALCASASAQSVSFGLVGGASATDAFRTQSIPLSFPDFPAFRFFSQSKDWIAGGMVEVRLPAHWSVEVDGLFRELHLTWAAVEPNGTLNSVSPSPVVTWEFPVLVKRRFQWSVVKPFVEAGPAFRTTGNLNATPSHHGVAAGAGVELRFHGLNIAPTVRYTRWAADLHLLTDNALSNRNQVELFVAFSRATATNFRPFGEHVSIGAVAGLSLTADYADSLLPPEKFSFNGFDFTVLSRSRSHDFLAGPTVEFTFGRLSAELNAVYRPYRQITTVHRSDGFVGPDGVSSTATWEFPVLAKYKLPTVSRATPFVEAGPAFRIPWTVSNYGATAGAGIALRTHYLQIAPTLGYTRWQRDFSGTNQNQFQLLLGFSF